MTGSPSTTKTSDLTICATEQPTARAASSAVRVPCGKRTTSIERPALAAACTTRWTLGWSGSPPGAVMAR